MATTQYLDGTGLTTLVTKIKAEDTKIKNLIGTVPAKVGETETATVIAYVDAKDAAADARLTSLESNLGDAGSVADQITTVTGTPDSGKTLQSEIDAVEAAITTLNGDSNTTGSVAKAVADEASARDTAISTAIGTLTVAEGADSNVANAIAKAASDASSALTTKVESLDATVRANLTEADAIAEGKKVGVKVVEEDGKITGVTVVENDIASAATVSSLVGSDTGKSVRTIANEELAAQLIPENAKESLDTLTEIAAWIQAHPDDASAMNTAISNLQALIGESAKGDSESTIVSRISTIETAIDTGTVTNATNATNATNDADGNNISTTYIKAADIESISDDTINALF